MDILFKRKKDREIANNESRLRKEFRGNPRRSKLVRNRLDELADVNNLAEMSSLPQAGCHELKGSRADQLAVKLDKGFRMIFEVANEPIPRKADSGLDWSQVTTIRILNLAEDYHD